MEIEIEKELIDILEDGCYAVRFSSLYGDIVTDCTVALRSDNAVVLLIVSTLDGIKIFVVYATPDGNILREYSRIEDAVRDIKRSYGEEVVRKLLAQALHPWYSINDLETRLREIFEE